MRLRLPKADTPQPTTDTPRKFIAHLQASDDAWADFIEFIKTLDIETLRKYDFGKTYEDYLNIQGQRQQLQELCLRCGVNLATLHQPQE